MSFKEIVFNIIIPLISGIIGGTITANIIVHKNTNKSSMKNKNLKNINGDIINGNKNQ